MAENNIIIRLLGEADMSESTKAIQDQIKVTEGLEKELMEVAKRYEDAEKSIKNLNLAASQEERTLKSISDVYKSQARAIQDQINASKKNITLLEQNTKATNLLSNSTDSAKKRLAEMKNLMAQMEEEGNLGKSYEELAMASANLVDQLGDMQQRINILASDTKNLDAAMSLGSGLTGTFNVATSAVELLGGSTEGLQKSFYKVQAALSILNGVQSVANTLNKDSAFRVVAKAAADEIAAKAAQKKAAGETIFTKAAWASSAATLKGTIVTTAKTVATNAAAAAQWLWNAALAANPIGAVVAAVAALVAGIGYLIHRQKESAAEARNFAGTLKDVQKSIEENEKATDYAARLAEAEGKAWRDVAAIQRNGLADQVNEAARAYNEMLEKKKVVNGKIKKEEQEAMDEMKKLYDEKHAEFLKQEQDFHIKEVAEATQAAKDKADKEKQSAQKRADEIKSAESELENMRINLMKDGIDKEIKTLELNYKRKIDAIKGNSKAEVELRAALEQEMQNKIADVREKEEKANAEKTRQLIQLRLDVMRDGEDKEVEQVRLGYEKQLEEAEKGSELYNALIEKREKELSNIRTKYANKRLAEQAEMLRLESESDQFDIEKRKAYYQADAEAKIASLDKQAMSDQEYANAVLEIRNKLKKDLNTISEEETANEVAAAQMTVSKINDEYERIGEGDASSKLAVLQRRFAAEMELYDKQEQEIEKLQQNGTISKQEYEDRLYEIKKNRLEAETQLVEDSTQVEMDAAQKVLDTMSQMFTSAFSAATDLLQQQIDKLDEMYTTDAEEAKKNANKKLISEEEYEKKKAALELKRAKYAKAQALVDIAIQTALAVITGFAQMGIPGAVLAAAMGATSLAVAAAKPLAQYAKGRKGGKGEMAIVGEKGPELMYVPQGASIIPNNKLDRPNTWGEYGVPKLATPEMPNIQGIISQAYGLDRNGFDYDRLGKAVASNMPHMSPVSVNVDRNGVTVSDGRSNRTYLNTKYQAVWS